MHEQFSLLMPLPFHMTRSRSRNSCTVFQHLMIRQGFAQTSARTFVEQHRLAHQEFFHAALSLPLVAANSMRKTGNVTLRVYSRKTCMRLTMTARTVSKSMCRRCA